MNAKVLALVGVVLLVAGLIVGFAPVSSGGADCGSAFNPESGMTLAITAGWEAINGCESLHSILAIPAWILMGIGALLLVVSLAFAGKKESQEAGSAR
jgi:hypothetical protein